MKGPYPPDVASPGGLPAVPSILRKASELVTHLHHLWWARKRPAGHVSLLLGDLLLLPGRNRRNDDLLDAAVEWLCLAQDQSGCGGVCGLYDLFRGWSGPYPETTGYIVPTFLRASKQVNRPDLAARAEKMLDWLVDTQLDCGAFPGGITTGGRQTDPRVFNTGQIMLGLLAGFRFFGAEKCIDSAVRAADWLCETQDADGAWRSASYGGFPHAYHTRVAWPLIALGLATGCDRYLEAGERNLAWVLRQQQADGWFDHTEMAAGEPAHLHPIAYTLRGLWEAGALLARRDYQDAVLQGVERLLSDAEHSRLAGAYASGWQPAGSHLCLTGHAQMACLWMRMYLSDPDIRLFHAASRTIDLLGRLQDLDNPSSALRGGLRGSYPITGPYMPWCIINWGTKFFLDALLLERLCRDRAEFQPAEASPRIVGHERRPAPVSAREEHAPVGPAG